MATLEQHELFAVIIARAVNAGIQAADLPYSSAARVLREMAQTLDLKAQPMPTFIPKRLWKSKGPVTVSAKVGARKPKKVRVAKKGQTK